jgi:hypothetical protein
MSVNPINKRQLIEEEVYDELPSPDIPDKIDSDIEYGNFKSNEIICKKFKGIIVCLC